MGRGNEEGFVLAAGHIDTTVEQSPKVFCIASCIALARGVPVGGFLRIEKQREHATDARDGVWNVGLFGGRGKAAFQAAGECFQALIRRIFNELLECGDATRGGDGIATKRASLKHFAGRKNVLHDLTAAAIGTDGHSAADNFSERCDVGVDLKQRLGATVGHAETGHNFVAD